MLIWILAAIAAALIPIIVVAASADRKYRRLFRDDHLIELGALLARLSEEAAAADAPRSGATDHGLAVTWRPRGPEVVLSMTGGKLAPPAAAFLLSWIAALLTVPPEARRRYVSTARLFTLRFEGVAEDFDPSLSLPDEARREAMRIEAAGAMREVTFEAR